MARTAITKKTEDGENSGTKYFQCRKGPFATGCVLHSLDPNPQSHYFILTSLGTSHESYACFMFASSTMSLFHQCLHGTTPMQSAECKSLLSC